MSLIVDGIAYSEHRARMYPVDNAKARKVEYRPVDDHFNTVLRAPCVVTIDGERVIVASPAPPGAEIVRVAVDKHLKAWDAGGRTLGLKGDSRTFGFRPRNALRMDYCAANRMQREEPAVAQLMYQWATKVSDRLAFWMPEIHAEQAEWMEEAILPEWKIPNSVYTSGICNRNNGIAYHRDQGNHKGSWSSMLAFQHDMEGGLLVMPELSIAFDFTEPTLIQFDGMRVLHGVTHLKPRTLHGYRYTVVWYCREQLKACLPLPEEIVRFQRLKTEREIARARLSPEELKARLGVK